MSIFKNFLPREGVSPLHILPHSVDSLSRKYFYPISSENMYLPCLEKRLCHAYFQKVPVGGIPPSTWGGWYPSHRNFFSSVASLPRIAWLLNYSFSHTTCTSFWKPDYTIPNNLYKNIPLKYVFTMPRITSFLCVFSKSSNRGRGYPPSHPRSLRFLGSMTTQLQFFTYFLFIFLKTRLQW